MKKIEAFLPPQRVDHVMSGLEDVVYHTLALTAVRLHDPARRVRKQWMGHAYYEDLSAMHLHLLVDDDVVARAMSIVCDRGFDGTPGEGRLVSYTVDASLAPVSRSD